MSDTRPLDAFWRPHLGLIQPLIDRDPGILRDNNLDAEAFHRIARSDGGPRFLLELAARLLDRQEQLGPTARSIIDEIVSHVAAAVAAARAGDAIRGDDQAEPAAVKARARRVLLGEGMGSAGQIEGMSAAGRMHSIPRIPTADKSTHIGGRDGFGRRVADDGAAAKSKAPARDQLGRRIDPPADPDSDDAATKAERKPFSHRDGYGRARKEH